MKFQMKTYELEECLYNISRAKFSFTDWNSIKLNEVEKTILFKKLIAVSLGVEHFDIGKGWNTKNGKAPIFKMLIFLVSNFIRELVIFCLFCYQKHLEIKSRDDSMYFWCHSNTLFIKSTQGLFNYLGEFAI